MPEGSNNIAFAKYATALQALQPNIAEVVTAHTMALRRLKQFLIVLADAFHYDPGSPLHEPDDFRDLLQVCSVLLWNDGDSLWSDPNDKKHWKQYDYWKQKSEKDGWDGISYFSAQSILVPLLSALTRLLRAYRKRILTGKFYWSHRNPEYLALVYETTIPDVDNKEGLITWANEYDKRIQVVAGSGTDFAYRARTPTLTNGKQKKT